MTRSGHLTRLWRAALCEGVKSNGARFVLLLTNARPGRKERTKGLGQAIAGARHNGVEIAPEAEQDFTLSFPFLKNACRPAESGCRPICWRQAWFSGRRHGAGNADRKGRALGIG